MGLRFATIEHAVEPGQKPVAVERGVDANRKVHNF